MGVDSIARKRVVDAVNQLNREQLHGVGDPEIATRISQYEMAYRMQSSVPELQDLSKESSQTLEAYGLKSEAMASPTTACLPVGWSNGVSASFNCSIRMGSSQQCLRSVVQQVQASRPAHCRPHQRLEGTGIVG